MKFEFMYTVPFLKIYIDLLREDAGWEINVLVLGRIHAPVTHDLVFKGQIRVSLMADLWAGKQFRKTGVYLAVFSRILCVVNSVRSRHFY